MATNFFAWDWQAPFRQAGGGRAFSTLDPALPNYDWTQFRQPASPRATLTLADLWSPAPRPQYPAPPEPYQSYEETGPEAKKNLRREAILRAAMALGGDPGRIGTNLAAASASVGGWKQEQLEAARARQQQDYTLSSRQAEFDADRERYDREDATRKIKAQGALQAVEAVIDAEPEWGARAEAAARAGDFDALDKMLADAEERRRIRASGGDPDDPLWEEKAKGKLKSDAEIEAEERLREKGLGRYYDEPVDLEEIEAKARAGAKGSFSVWGNRQGGGGADGGPPEGTRLIEHGDRAFEYKWDPEQGGYVGSPVPGSPEPTPKWEKIEDRGAGEVFFYDPVSGQRKQAPTGLNRTFEALEERHKRSLSDQEKKVIEKQWAQGATPMLLGETVSYVQQTIGRPLTAKERREVEGKWRQGTRAGLIAQQMKGPKPPGKGAPTQGNVRRPPVKSNKQSALPPPLRRQPVSEQDKRDLRAEVDARFAALSSEERERKYQQALQLLRGA